MAHLQIERDFPLENLHQNIEFNPQQWFWDSGYERGSSQTQRLQRYLEVNAELQKVIDQAAAEGKEFRALGSAWSTSKAAYTKDWLLQTIFQSGLRATTDNDALDLDDFLTASSTRGIRGRNLAFVEAGINVRDLNLFLADRHQALMTSGSNDGQTIAGAIATGTHGSSRTVGGMADFVHGMHLLAGDGRNIFLQRESRQLVDDRFAQALGAQLRNDDTLFDAAVVGLGCFGVIRSLLIETQDRHSLQLARFWHPVDDALWKAMLGTGAVRDLDFRPAFEEGLPPDAVDKELLHFQLYFEPNGKYDKDSGLPKDVLVLTQFRDEWVPDEGVSIPGRPAPAPAAIELLQAVAKLLPKLVRKQVSKGVRREVLKPYYLRVTPQRLVREPRAHGEYLLSGTAVPRAESGRALQLAFDLYREHYLPRKVLPMLFAVRFLPASKAMLGFNQFDENCVIDVDSARTDDAVKFVKDYWRALKDAGIPFAVHWGKIDDDLIGELQGDDATAGLATFGDAVDTWKAMRAQWLGDRAPVFSNDFLRALGLD